MPPWIAVHIFPGGGGSDGSSGLLGELHGLVLIAVVLFPKGCSAVGVTATVIVIHFNFTIIEASRPVIIAFT